MGATAGTMGTTAGTMGATAGTMGATAGTTGTTAGTTGATDDPCAADSGLTGAALHGAVAMFLGTQPGSCNGMSCHDSAGPPKAGLLLGGQTDLNATLVGVTSCTAPNLPLIAAGDPAGSFLWQKVYAAPADASGLLTGNPAWGTPGSCGQPVGSYGVRMPQGLTTTTATHERLVELCDWIQAGAPGP
jgi:hypothetical protein